MNDYFRQVAAFLSRLSMQQKLAIGGVLIGGISLFGGIAYWANQPDYALLFGGLGPSDANNVVESLTERGVRYELRESGSAVYVPREDVYELRLSFAGQGMVSDGPAGYELFDSGTLGMTDFMQRLNMKRALEGELSRTITSLSQVSVSRVHLVMPERSAFRDNQNEPSASVVLQMAGSARLGEPQIDGISALVAGAVEGMNPSAVTVLDTRGNVLSRPERGDGEGALTATQIQMQDTVENRLVDKGQSMLDEVLGRGNAIVRVSAELDFTRTIAESEIIDPESATIIAEEKLDQSAGDTNEAQSSIRNYELSRTVERSEKGVGAIKYLTVSVILNKRAEPTDQEGQPPVIVPYTGEEISEIEELVQNAVGYNPDRGDRITVHQTEFDNRNNTALADEFAEQRKTERFQLMLRYGLIAGALLMAFLLLRSVLKRASTIAPGGNLSAPTTRQGLPGATTAGQLAAGGAPGGQAALGAGGNRPALNGGNAAPAQLGAGSENDIYQAKLSDEAQVAFQTPANPYEDIVKMANASPDVTAEIVREWLEKDKIEA